MLNTISLTKISHYLEKWAPPKTAAKWDNCGLQLGNPDAPIKQILLSLDVDNLVLSKLENTHYDLVITHHPLFFNPIKQIDYTSDLGKIISTFTAQNTNLFSMHTNLDLAENGVNDCLIKQYDLNPEEGAPIDGFGKWFSLKKPLSFEKFFEQLNCQIIGKEREKINKIGFCAGSGNGLVNTVRELGLDVFITGELSYHNALYCEMNNITALLLGHKESEIFIFPEMKKRLLAMFPGLSIDIC